MVKSLGDPTCSSGLKTLIVVVYDDDTYKFVKNINITKYSKNLTSAVKNLAFMYPSLGTMGVN